MPDGIRARPLEAAVIVLVLVGLGACTAAQPAPTPHDVPPPDLPTLKTIIEAEPEQPEFELVEETTDFDGDDAEVVSYASGGLDVQAVIRRAPSQGQSSPAIVFVHGNSGQEDYSGLTEYDEFVDLFVDAGYTVVQPDLRGHGDSDDGDPWEIDMDVGATLDIVNAARATAVDPLVDPSRIAIVGYSSGATMAVKASVVAPEVARAVVALAPSHVSPWEEVRRFLSGTPDYDTVVAAHGDAEESPEYWRDVSALTFVDRAEAPLLIVHGTHDEVTPIGWSRLLNAEWSEAGKDVTLTEMEGADHALNEEIELVAETVTEFLGDRSL